MTEEKDAEKREQTELENLYQQKGELVTNVELAQARLQALNQRILEILNAAKGT